MGADFLDVKYPKSMQSP